MNLFFWKKNTVIDDFASNLANELYSAIPPDQALEYFMNETSHNKSTKIQKKLEQQIQLSIAQIRHFKIKYSLGIYGKARLHLKFANRLKELGYAHDITKRINELLLITTP